MKLTVYKIVEKPLGKLCVMTNGSTADQSKEITDFPITRIETISSGKIDKRKVNYVEFSQKEIENYKLDVGDILFSHINSFERVGHSAIVVENDLPIYHGMNLLRIKPNSEIICPEYLFLFLKTNHAKSFYEEFAQRAINQASINQNTLKELRVLYPENKTDQQHIASQIISKLEKVEQMRQAALQQKEAVEALQGALLREVFPFKEGDELPKGWKWEKLEKIFEEVKNQVQPYEEEFKTLPFVGLENVVSHTREYTDEEYNPPASTCFKFDETNILYGKLRPYLNKVFLPSSKGKSSMELIPLKTKNNYSREFLAAVLQSEAVIGDTVKFSTGGRMPRADLKKLKKLEIAIPSDVNLCKKLGLVVSNKIKEFIELNKEAKKQLEAIEALPAAILREVFEFKTN